MQIVQIVGFGAAIDAKPSADVLRSFRDKFRLQRNMRGGDAIAVLPGEEIDGPSYTMSEADYNKVIQADGLVRASLGGAVSTRALAIDPRTDTLNQLISKITMTLQQWDALVATESRPPTIKKQTSGVVVAAGLFIGVAVVGAFAYARYKGERGR